MYQGVCVRMACCVCMYVCVRMVSCVCVYVCVYVCVCGDEEEVQ